MKLKEHRSPDGTLQGYTFKCPGCNSPHMYYDKMADGSPGWIFNGNLEKPTFTPSLLNTYTPHESSGRPKKICHLFLTDGILQYCSDCTHPMAGKSVPLPELPEGS